MKGRVYLLVEKTHGGRDLRVTSHRMTKPSRGAAEGVWVGLTLDVPESVFGPYEASLSLPESDLRGVVTVFGVEEPGVVVGSNEDPNELDGEEE
jgi:hypothetical protein